MTDVVYPAIMLIAGAAATVAICLLIPRFRRWRREHLYWRREARLLRQITDSIPLLLLHIDRDHRIQWMNGIAQLWFGRETAELIGMHLLDAVGPAFYEVMQAQVDFALAGEQSCYENVPVVDGGTRHYSIIYLPVRDRHGRATGLHIVIEDITDQHRTLMMLRDVEKRMTELKTIRSTTATCEHQINNPLTGIIAIGQMLQDEDMSQEDRAAMVGELLTAARRIQNVLGQLAKIDRPRYVKYPTGDIDIIDVQ